MSSVVDKAISHKRLVIQSEGVSQPIVRDLVATGRLKTVGTETNPR
jgi:hypothetical protein